jgi:carboxymethylenebutenolidase
MQLDVYFPCDDGHAMRGVLTLPDGAGEGRRPGLLLLYEVFGMNEEMKRVARDLASEGYVVLIPDLFDRGAKVLCIARAIRDITRGEGRSFADLEAARRFLSTRPEVDGARLGVIGFCMGGAFTLVLAMKGDYRAAAPFYGQVPDIMPRACPVVASFGERDEPLRDAASKLRRHLERLGVDHDIKVYEDAGHSFYTQPVGFIAEKLGPLLPMHAAYHEPSAVDARRRVIAFFQKHLVQDDTTLSG